MDFCIHAMHWLSPVSIGGSAICCVFTITIRYFSEQSDFFDFNTFHKICRVQINSDLPKHHPCNMADNKGQGKPKLGNANAVPVTGKLPKVNKNNKHSNSTCRLSSSSKIMRANVPTIQNINRWPPSVLKVLTDGNLLIQTVQSSAHFLMILISAQSSSQLRKSVEKEN